MVYDVTKAESFNHCHEWLVEVNKYASDSTCKLLIGNKCDRKDKVVAFEDAKAFAESLGNMSCIETSAKTAENVEEAFITMANANTSSKAFSSPSAAESKPLTLEEACEAVLVNGLDAGTGDNQTLCVAHLASLV
jgi:Ras-related protein Rab-1A